MTTVQESTNGHRVFPPPCSVENPSDANRADLPANKADNSHFAANCYHVPPKPFTPNPKLDQPNDYSERAKRLEPLPERCQFMFSDGRQCTMARSDIHPSLCTYHSDREQQLFGDPSCRCEARTLDFPELFSASRDLTTAAGVNRALAQVFRMLAQRRISRQEAATFAKLGHLLLQTISAVRAESIPGENDQANTVILSSGESHGDQELSPVNNVQRERRIPPELSPVNKVQRERSARTVSAAANSPAPPPAPAAATAPFPGRTVANNSSEINTSASAACNSPEINTYEIAGFKPVQNQHLYKESREAPVPQLSAHPGDRQSNSA